MMQIRRATKHFLSSLLNPQLNTSSEASSRFLYVSLAHFSSNPRRPSRGTIDDESSSEDQTFGRAPNFGDGASSEKDYPIRSPNCRTMRGETMRSNLERGNEKGGNSLGGIGFGGTLFDKLKLGEKSEEEKEDEPRLVKVEFNGSAQPESPPQEGSDEILRKMKETGLIPNAVLMLDGLCKDGLVHEAMKLFSSMREKGSIPEVVIYAAVVEAFFKAGKIDDAKRIFRKMRKNGVVPNAYSYGLIIQWLCTWGKLDDCVEFCVEMFETGHAPNAQTFVRLVHGFCEVKGKEEARELVKSFQDRNFAIDEKSIREYLDKNGPFHSDVSEVIFGEKKGSKTHF